MGTHAVEGREARDQIWDVVAQSCLYLDDEKYEQYLGLMHEDRRKDLEQVAAHRVDRDPVAGCSNCRADEL